LLRIAELPYVFRNRIAGSSKLDARNAVDFIELLVTRLTNDAVSFRFLMFCAVGLSGVAIHMAALRIALGAVGLPFGAGEIAATATAICWNFALNNVLTYRDQRLKGWQFITGLMRFVLVCSVGAISNTAAASWIYAHNADWWVSGLGGALMGAVWNYLVSAAFVWHARSVP
jgi:dolichol-phosphate mannosyltransferase